MPEHIPNDRTSEAFFFAIEALYSEDDWAKFEHEASLEGVEVSLTVNGKEVSFVDTTRRLMQRMEKMKNEEVHQTVKRILDTPRFEEYKNLIDDLNMSIATDISRITNFNLGD